MLYFERKSKNSHSGNEKFILHGNQGIFSRLHVLAASGKYVKASRRSLVKKGLVCTEIRPRKAAGVLHTSLAAQKFYSESATEISDYN